MNMGATPAGNDRTRSSRRANNNWNQINRSQHVYPTPFTDLRTHHEPQTQREGVNQKAIGPKPNYYKNQGVPKRGRALKTLLLATLCAVAVTRNPETATAQVVISNTPNNTNGGSSVSDTSQKALIFRTGPVPTKINSLTLGLNARRANTPLPYTSSVTATLWSTTKNGGAVTPLAPISTLVSPTSVTIRARQQLYTFNIGDANNSADLSANTTYALVLSGDASEIKWGQNDGNTPIGLNGFSYIVFQLSDFGGEWTSNGVSQENALAIEIYPIPIGSILPQSYAAFQSVGLETLKRQRELVLAEAGSCRDKGWVINQTRTKSEAKNDKLGSLCFFAQAGNSTSSISGNNELSSYNSGVFTSLYSIEYQLSHRWTLGTTYGYGTSYLNNMTTTNTSISSTVNSGSLYGVYKPAEAWTIRALAGYANFGIESSRNVPILDGGTAIQGNFNANGYTIALNTDYRIPLTGKRSAISAYVKPLAGIAWGSYSQNAFTETGVEYLNLNVQQKTANSATGTLGLEIAADPIKASKKSTFAIQPKIAIAYQVDALGKNESEKSIASTFASSPPSSSILIDGQNRGVNSLIVDGRIELFFTKDISLYASAGYEQFSNGNQVNYSGGIKYLF